MCCFSVLFVVYTCTSIFICAISCLRSAGYFKTGTSIPLQPTRRVLHSTAIQPSSRVRISSYKVIIFLRLIHPDGDLPHEEVHLDDEIPSNARNIIVLGIRNNESFVLGNDGDHY